MNDMGPIWKENLTDLLSSFPTFWIPRRRDIFLIARFFQLAGCGEILDLGCGNGFLAYLLAYEGLKVCGVDLLDSFRDYSGMMFSGEVSLNITEDANSGASFIPDDSRTTAGKTEGAFLSVDSSHCSSCCPSSAPTVSSVSASSPVSSFSFNPSTLRFLCRNALDLPPDTFDGVFLSWADRGVNKAFMVQRQNPLAVAYIIETTGLTGDRECRYIFDLLEAYRPAMYWDNVNHRDLESAVLHEESGLEDFPASSHNRVILFLRRDFQGNIQRDIDGHIQGGIEETMMGEADHRPPPYPWEKDLDEYFPVGMQVDDRRKTLWKPVVIRDEERFLRGFCSENAYMAGIVR